MTDANLALGYLADGALLGGEVRLDRARGRGGAGSRRRGRSAATSRRPRRASWRSPTRRWRARCAASRWSAASTRATSRCWPSAAPGRCTPARWPRSSACARCSCRARAACSRPSASRCPTSGATTPRPHRPTATLAAALGGSARARRRRAARARRWRRAADVRYRGQSFELDGAGRRPRRPPRALPRGPRAALRLPAGGRAGRGRAAAGDRDARRRRARRSWRGRRRRRRSPGAGASSSRAWTSTRRCSTARRLGAGSELRGPAIVELDGATCLVAPGWAGGIDAAGTLVLAREGA